MRTEILDLMGVRRGHFLLESGHHGDLWLDLDALFENPTALRPFVHDLARSLDVNRLDGVCGPLTGGAFVAQMLALELGVKFWFTERTQPPREGTLYSARYALAAGQRVAGARVAVVDDVINAGSAVTSTLSALRSAGAMPAALGALLVLGQAAEALASKHSVPLHSTARLDNALWPPAACPRCAAGVPLDTTSTMGGPAPPSSG
ncbi:phosphoribosyltransferase family protein [Actinopolymorpha sp. B17G11]|uniref:orotate phosphoribosyltransferase n=1 Tax=unclassified Actinopolymorpha TaxID=2627063 RepID=UPI0032D92649